MRFLRRVSRHWGEPSSLEKTAFGQWQPGALKEISIQSMCLENRVCTCEGVGRRSSDAYQQRDWEEVTAFRSFILCTMTKGFEGTLKARKGTLNPMEGVSGRTWVECFGLLVGWRMDSRSQTTLRQGLGE